MITINIISKNSYILDLILHTPELLLHRKREDEIDCGPVLRNLDTGVHFNKYEYGYSFNITLLGFGVGFRVVKI